MGRGKTNIRQLKLIGEEGRARRAEEHAEGESRTLLGKNFMHALVRSQKRSEHISNQMGLRRNLRGQPTSPTSPSVSARSFSVQTMNFMSADEKKVVAQLIAQEHTVRSIMTLKAKDRATQVFADFNSELRQILHQERRLRRSRSRSNQNSETSSIPLFGARHDRLSINSACTSSSSQQNTPWSATRQSHLRSRDVEVAPTTPTNNNLSNTSLFQSQTPESSLVPRPVSPSNKATLSPASSPSLVIPPHATPLAIAAVVPSRSTSSLISASPTGRTLPEANTPIRNRFKAVGRAYVGVSPKAGGESSQRKRESPVEASEDLHDPTPEEETLHLEHTSDSAPQQHRTVGLSVSHEDEEQVANRMMSQSDRALDVAPASGLFEAPAETEAASLVPASPPPLAALLPQDSGFAATTDSPEREAKASPTTESPSGILNSSQRLGTSFVKQEVTFTADVSLVHSKLGASTHSRQSLGASITSSQGERSGQDEDDSDELDSSDSEAGFDRSLDASRQVMRAALQPAKHTEPSREKNNFTGMGSKRSSTVRKKKVQMLLHQSSDDESSASNSSEESDVCDATGYHQVRKAKGAGRDNLTSSEEQMIKVKAHQPILDIGSGGILKSRAAFSDDDEEEEESSQGDAPRDFLVAGQTSGEPGLDSTRASMEPPVQSREVTAEGIGGFTFSSSIAQGDDPPPATGEMSGFFPSPETESGILVGKEQASHKTGPSTQSSSSTRFHPILADSSSSDEDEVPSECINVPGAPGPGKNRRGTAKPERPETANSTDMDSETRGSCRGSASSIPDPDVEQRAGPPVDTVDAKVEMEKSGSQEDSKSTRSNPSTKDDSAHEVDFETPHTEQRALVEGEESNLRTHEEDLAEHVLSMCFDFQHSMMLLCREAEEFESCLAAGQKEILTIEAESREKGGKLESMLFRRIIASFEAEVLAGRERQGIAVFERGWLLLGSRETLQRGTIFKEQDDNFYALSDLLARCIDYFSAAELLKAQLESEWEFSLRVAILSERVELARKQREQELQAVLRSEEVRDSFMLLRMAKHMPYLYHSIDFTQPNRSFFLSTFITAKQQPLSYTKPRLMECESAMSCYRPQKQTLPFVYCRPVYSPIRVDRMLRREWCTMLLTGNMRRCLLEAKSLEVCKRAAFNLPRIKAILKSSRDPASGVGSERKQRERSVSVKGGIPPAGSALKAEYKRLSDKRISTRNQSLPFETRSAPKVSMTRRMLTMKRRATISHTAYVAIPYERSAKFLKSAMVAYRERKALGAVFHENLERLGAVLLIQHQYRRWQLANYKRKVDAISGFDRGDQVLRRVADGQNEAGRLARLERDSTQRTEFLEKYVHDTLNIQLIQRFCRVRVTHRLLQERIAAPSGRAYKCLCRWMKRVRGMHTARRRRMDRQEAQMAKEQQQNTHWMAVRLQSWYRGVLCRQRTLRLLEIERTRRTNLREMEEFKFACATLVSSNFRRWGALTVARRLRSRLQREREIDELRQKREYYATVIQNKFRAWKMRRSFLKLLREDFSKMLDKKVRQLDLTPAALQSELLSHMRTAEHQTQSRRASLSPFGNDPKRPTDIFRVLEAARKEAGIRDKEALTTRSFEVESDSAQGTELHGFSFGGSQEEGSTKEISTSQDVDHRTLKDEDKDDQDAAKILPSVSFAIESEEPSAPSAHETPIRQDQNLAADVSESHVTMPVAALPGGSTLVSRTQRALEQAHMLSSRHSDLLQQLSTSGNRDADDTAPKSQRGSIRSNACRSSTSSQPHQGAFASSTAKMTRPSTAPLVRWARQRASFQDSGSMVVMDGDEFGDGPTSPQSLSQSGSRINRTSTAAGVPLSGESFRQKHERLQGKRAPHPLLRKQAPNKSQQVRRDQWESVTGSPPPSSRVGGTGFSAVSQLNPRQHSNPGPAKSTSTNQRKATAIALKFGESARANESQGSRTAAIHRRNSSIRSSSPPGATGEDILQLEVEDVLEERRNVRYYHPLRHEPTTELVKPRRVRSGGSPTQ